MNRRKYEDIFANGKGFRTTEDRGRERRKRKKRLKCFMYSNHIPTMDANTVCYKHKLKIGIQRKISTRNIEMKRRGWVVKDRDFKTIELYNMYVPTCYGGCKFSALQTHTNKKKNSHKLSMSQDHK